VLYIISAAILLSSIGLLTDLIINNYRRPVVMAIFIIALFAILIDTLQKLRRFLFTVLALILVILIAIQTDFVQNWLVGMATDKLSKALGTEVRIKKVSLSLFNKLNMEGTLVKDKQKD